MITKAIIPVAGWGTRRLPITKSIEKCMLPIGNRPMVDYVVQDCIAAGITDIYFVVSTGSTQLQEYYGSNEKLNTYLIQNNKQAQLPLVAPPEGVNFHYIEQDALGKYGTAIPVALAAEYIEKGESVVVLMGDDFIYHTDGASETARLIAGAGTSSALLGVPIEPEEVVKYGVIATNERGAFAHIVEKPTAEEAPSNLINVSKYVIDSELMRHIVTYAATEQAGEYYITEPINAYVAEGGTIAVIPAEGVFLDGGSVEGWLHANNVVVGGNNQPLV